MAERPSLAAITWTFLRVGNTTLGGGNPTMAALQRELCTRRGWLTEDQQGLAYGLARVTPGTNILAYCAGCGWILAGAPGAIAAVMGLLIPTAVIAALFAGVYEAWQGVPAFRAAISGVVASAAGMMVASAFILIRARALKSWLWPGLGVVVGAFVLSYTGWLSPVPVLVLGAGVGFLRGDHEK